jgi:hypothetical protein
LAIKSVEGAEEGATSEITVVFNWFEELRERMEN